MNLNKPQSSLQGKYWISFVVFDVLPTIVGPVSTYPLSKLHVLLHRTAIIKIGPRCSVLDTSKDLHISKIVSSILCNNKKLNVAFNRAIQFQIFKKLNEITGALRLAPSEKPIFHILQ